MKTNQIVTIDTDQRGDIVVRDESGNVLARRHRSCNPAALAQAILDAETIGVIDWDASKVAKPESAA